MKVEQMVSNWENDHVYFIVKNNNCHWIQKKKEETVPYFNIVRIFNISFYSFRHLFLVHLAIMFEVYYTSLLCLCICSRIYPFDYEDLKFYDIAIAVRTVFIFIMGSSMGTFLYRIGKKQKTSCANMDNCLGLCYYFVQKKIK